MTKLKILPRLGNMINKCGKNTNNTSSGFNVRVTSKTMEQLKKIKESQAEKTGVNIPLSAIVGKLVHDKANEVEANDGNGTVLD